MAFTKAAQAEERVWTLSVYSEDYVSKPEIMEWIADEISEEEGERAWRTYYSKAELWNLLKRQYPGKHVPVRYADGARSGFVVPRVA